jgi:DNA repair exonuclease SbcCD ATPase subunit
MQLAKVVLEQWKSLSTSFELGRLNLLLGPNGAGKTALLSAPSFAITGRSVLGDRVDASAQLCGPGGGSVLVALDDGFTWGRGIVRDVQTGKASMTLDIGGVPKASLKELHPQVAGHVGDFAPMHDLTVFLGLSAEKRRAFILDLCGRARGDEVDKTEVLAWIELECYRVTCGDGTVNLILRDIAKTGATDVRYEEAISQIRAKLGGELGTAVRTAMESQLLTLGAELTGDPSEAIGAAMTKAKEVVNASRYDHDAAVKASQALAQRRAEIDAIAESAESLEQAKATLTEQRIETQSELDQARGRQKARETLVVSIRSADVALESLKKRRDELQTTSLEDLQEAHQAVNLNLSTAKDAETTAKADVEQVTVLLNERDACVERGRLARSTAADLLSKREELGRELGVLENASEHARLRFDAQLVREYVEGAYKQDSKGAIPFLPAQRLEAYIHDTIPAVDNEQANRIVALDAEVVQNIAETHKAVTGLDAIQAELDKANAALEKLGNTDAIRARLNTASEQVTSLIRQRDKVESEIKDLERSRATVEADITSRNERLTEARRQLDALEEEHSSAPLTELAAHVDAIDRQLTGISQKLEKKRRFQVLERELAECVANAEKLLTEHEVAKMIWKAVGIVREPLMLELVEPIVKHVNTFLVAAGQDVACYVSLTTATGKPAFEIGWRTDVARIPIEALSAGERAMFGCALAYGLMQLSDVPLKLLLLEAGPMDAANQRSVMRAAEKLQDKLGNVILATHVPMDGADAEKWNAIVLE